jgi:hypothetical protein
VPLLRLALTSMCKSCLSLEDGFVWYRYRELHPHCRQLTASLDEVAFPATPREDEV